LVYKGNSYNNIWNQTIEFENPSRYPILPSDFDTPIIIKLEKGKFVDACITSNKIGVNIPIITVNENEIIINPFLLNFQESFVVDTLVGFEDSASMNISSRIIGGQLEQKKLFSKSDKLAFFVTGFIILIDLVILIYCIINITFWGQNWPFIIVFLILALISVGFCIQPLSYPSTPFSKIKEFFKRFFS